MNCKIPFTKDIAFEKKVSEITSISLEHELKVEEEVLKGNFIVSGDFKSHEVSVNKEPFSYILPFEIELSEDIDPKSIEFMIDDFTYEIVEHSVLRVNIDFNVIASKKEIVVKEEEPLFQDASNLFDEKIAILEENEEEEPKTELREEETIKDKEEPKIELREEEIIKDKEEEKEEKVNEEPRAPIAIEGSDVPTENSLDTSSEETIINSLKNTTDEYTTYHIHMVSDGETVETICTMYNSNMNILAEYNDLNDLTSGDKLIIPEKNE